MAQAEPTHTTRRDLLRFAAAAVPAAIVGGTLAASVPLEKSDAELLSIFNAAPPADRALFLLRAQFESLWESLLPLHISFVDWEGKPSNHPAYDEWNRLMESAREIAGKVLEQSAFTPKSFGLKAAAVLVTETDAFELGDRLDWGRRAIHVRDCRRWWYERSARWL